MGANRRRLVAAGLAMVVLAGCGAGGPGSAGSSGSAAPVAPAPPDFPVSPIAPDAPVGTVATPALPGSQPQPQAGRVSVVPGAVGLRPRPFDSTRPVGDRQLAVQFWGGVAPCSVIGRVDVAETPERVTVTLFGGRDPAAGQVACIELAVFQEVVVDLAAPLGGRAIADGAR